MKRVIKRYSNRKLYDTVTRRFTTLDDIARLIEGGQRVVVRDHDTGEDRTGEVLAPVLARLVASQPGGADLITGLLRAPVQIAEGLTGVRLSDSDRDSGRADRHEEEIRELRSQVSQLTDAVTLLLRQRNDELSA